MRDLVEDVQLMLNDNRYMNAHSVLSGLMNEIVGLRAEIKTLEQDYKSLWWDHQQCMKERRDEV